MILDVQFAFDPSRHNGAKPPPRWVRRVFSNELGSEELHASLEAMGFVAVGRLAGELVDDSVGLCVLRGAVPVWTAWRRLEGRVGTCFVSKGDWLSSTDLDLLARSKRIVMLDSVVATGSTLTSLYNRIRDGLSPSCTVAIACAIASPDAVAELTQISGIAGMSVCCLTTDVDKSGRVVPSTFGDIGDRLYSATPYSEID